MQNIEQHFCGSLCYPLCMSLDLQGMRNSFILYRFTLCRDISSLPKIVSQTALSVCPQSRRRRRCPASSTSAHRISLCFFCGCHRAGTVPHQSIEAFTSCMSCPARPLPPSPLSFSLHSKSFITLTTHTVPPLPLSLSSLFCIAQHKLFG